jgi:hypothetical protein
MPHDPLDVRESGEDLLVEANGISALVLEEVHAHVRRDGESSGNGKSEIRVPRHFREVGALSAEEVFHPFIAVGLAAAEKIHVLRSAHTVIAPFIALISSGMADFLCCPSTK